MQFSHSHSSQAQFAQTQLANAQNHNQLPLFEAFITQSPRLIEKTEVKKASAREASALPWDAENFLLDSDFFADVDFPEEAFALDPEPVEIVALPLPTLHAASTKLESVSAASIKIESKKIEKPRVARDDGEVFSELSLKGATGSCLNLLAPILRQLSDDQDARWLTLISPPASLTQPWLRDAGLNRERILILQPKGLQSAAQLTCEALRLGRSHTVVSWIDTSSALMHEQLIAAAREGDAQSLNIHLS